MISQRLFYEGQELHLNHTHYQNLGGGRLFSVMVDRLYSLVVHLQMLNYHTATRKGLM
jgi:hypothetical protein